MRTIKFKGKSIEDGKWNYGDLSHVGDQTLVKNNPVSDGRPVFTFAVDPSTVCQFTGLKDYENQDIYEGDILAEKRYPEFEVGYINCTFSAAYVGDDKFIFNLAALSEVCTVCGNKFDRKEGEK